MYAMLVHDKSAIDSYSDLTFSPFHAPLTFGEEIGSDEQRFYMYSKKSMNTSGKHTTLHILTEKGSSLYGHT